MLVAGYEQQFNESLRYWRTRFVVIPTLEPPTYSVSIGGGGGDRLNEEEIRIFGIEKLTEMFSRVRWQPPDERAAGPAPSVRLLVTDVGPAAMVLDDNLMAGLDEIHAAGPLRKKMKSERDIADMSGTCRLVIRLRNGASGCKSRVCSSIAVGDMGSLMGNYYYHHSITHPRRCVSI